MLTSTQIPTCTDEGSPHVMKMFYLDAGVDTSYAVDRYGFFMETAPSRDRGSTDVIGPPMDNDYLLYSSVSTESLLNSGITPHQSVENGGDEILDKETESDAAKHKGDSKKNTESNYIEGSLKRSSELNRSSGDPPSRRADNSHNPSNQNGQEIGVVLASSPIVSSDSPTEEAHHEGQSTTRRDAPNPQPPYYYTRQGIYRTVRTYEATPVASNSVVHGKSESAESQALQPSERLVSVLAVPKEYRRWVHIMEEYYAVVSHNELLREHLNGADKKKEIEARRRERGDMRDVRDRDPTLEASDGNATESDNGAVHETTSEAKKAGIISNNTALLNENKDRNNPMDSSAASTLENIVMTIHQLREVKSFLLKQMRLRIRRYGGVPCPTLRRHVWNFLVGSGYVNPKNKRRYHDTYWKLTRTDIDPDIADVISRDLNRTFPTHCLYQGSIAIGQTAMMRILHAYCAFDAELGYCQGMGFVIAVLSLQAPEEEVFWILVQLMYSPLFCMRQLYLPGFPLLQKFFIIFRILTKKLIPSVANHFENEGVDVSFFASQWFMTLFAYQFPISLVMQIWDRFFSEGWKVLFQVAISVLQWNQESLLKAKMEELFIILKSIHVDKDAVELLRRAMDVPISSSDLEDACYSLDLEK